THLTFLFRDRAGIISAGSSIKVNGEDDLVKTYSILKHRSHCLVATIVGARDLVSFEGGKIMIQVTGLTQYFKERKVLDNIHLTIEKNEKCALVGSNGAGKSTLIHSILGLIPYKEGSVKLAGFNNQTEKWKGKVSYLPEKFQLYPHLTCWENMLFFASMTGKNPNEANMGEHLGYVRLWESKDEQVKNFSKGMLQRLGIAIMLYYDSDILILDEPTSGLDPLGRIEILSILKGLHDKTVLFSSHHLDEIKQTCSHIAFLDNGKISKYLVKDFNEQHLLGGRLA
ncbi:MAG TPA: ABC transporter ATP-binding protein, partial [Bacillota bacterium]|nr:ABC transporter ATP-binding protein [Bacillota bacterium]